MNIAPSEKLYEILSKAKGTPDTKTVSYALARGFGMSLTSETPEPLEFAYRYAELLTLPKKIRDEILAGDRFAMVDALMWWERSLTKVFLALTMSGAWKDVKQDFSPEILSGIQASGAGIQTTFNYRYRVDKLRITSIVQSANDLISEVRQSDIDLDVKRTISKYLLLIIEALENYESSGIQQTQETVEKIAGSLELRSVLSKVDLNNKLFQRFWNVVQSTAVIVTLTGVAVPELYSSSKDAVLELYNPPAITESVKNEKLPIDVELEITPPRRDEEDEETLDAK